MLYRENVLKILKLIKIKQISLYLIKFLLTGALHDLLKLIYMHFSKKDKISQC